MGRTKQIKPMQRIPSGEIMQEVLEEPPNHTNGYVPEPKFHAVGRAPEKLKEGYTSSKKGEYSLVALIICVGGIYASFLTWAILQERITKTPYATVPRTFIPKASEGPAVEYWTFPVVLNTIQSFFAAISGSCYLLVKTGRLNAFPSTKIIWPLFLVSITASLASPFGYASLAYVDYLTYVLAKSCKLVPVVALHVSLFGKRYPLSKYLVVFAVTAGVIIFTLAQPAKKSVAKQARDARERLIGLTLLGVNLLFDGLTNTVQDHVFASKHKYGEINGEQMMVASNMMATALTVSYLILTPLIPKAIIPTFLPVENTTELASASQFLREHPSVLADVLGFAVCGAIGQLFIYATLERFDSILLVTVTVTRKMLTMLLSLVWFGKKLSPGQWSGVGLVFSGIATEGWLSRQEKARKAMRVKDHGNSEKKEL